VKLDVAHSLPAVADELVVRDRIDAALCSEALWPLLHGMPSRARYRDDHWAAYVAANASLARRVAATVAPTAAVWVDDFERAGVAAALRGLGHTGPIGLFVHTPVPPPDVLHALPWAAELVEQLRAFDLIVVHAEPWAFNLAGCFSTSARPEIAVVPVGIEPGAPADVDEQVARVQRSLAGRRLLLGVDPLTQVSGIVERLLAFERLLELEPTWRGAITLLQICLPPRAPDPALRVEVERLTACINGLHGEAAWTPIRYLYVERPTLAPLYRAADVAIVAPLCDSPANTAMEFLAAQDPARPGVLVTSQTCGELRDAILANPYHLDGFARALDEALRLDPDERVRRHARLAAQVTAAPSMRELFARLRASASHGR
jgi:trehalose 6-phosphate synthase